MTTAAVENDLKAAIRSIPDYPKPGIMFRDITTLLGNARAFRRAVDELVQPWAGGKIDKVAGIEARGFILGGAVAHQVSAGFVPIRKKGKLPFKRVSIGYSLEYGIDEMEMHEDAIEKGERVILVDDLIATGGTAEAAVKLLQQIGANVLAACFIIDLPELGGAQENRKTRRAGAHADRLRGALTLRVSLVFKIIGRIAVPAAMQGELQGTVYRFKFGEFEIATILDSKAIREGLHPSFGPEHSAEEARALCAANGIDSNRYVHPFTPTVVNTGKQVILFDTGNGFLRRDYRAIARPRRRRQLASNGSARPATSRATSMSW